MVNATGVASSAAAALKPSQRLPRKRRITNPRVVPSPIGTTTRATAVIAVAIASEGSCTFCPPPRRGDRSRDLPLAYTPKRGPCAT